MGLRTIFAVFFIGLGIVLYGTGSSKQRSEASMLQKVNPLSKDISLGGVVCLEGNVALSSPTLLAGLCLANLEYYTASGKLDGWKIETAHVQPIVLETAQGNAICIFKEVPLRGENITRIPLEARNADKKRQRIEGVNPGATMVVVGTVTALEPLALEVAYAYLGTKAQYDVFLEAGNDWLWKICAGCAAIGVLLLVPNMVNLFKKKEANVV